MILNVCNNPDFLSILTLVKPIIKLIQIAAPLYLIIMLMLDCVKAVTSGSGDIWKVFNKSKMRIISAVMIFMLPTILELVVSVFALTDVSYKNCLEKATPATINQLRVDLAEDAVAKAEKEKTESNLYKARNLVFKLESDKELKNALTLRLDAVKEKIEADKKAKEESEVSDFMTSMGSTCSNGVTKSEPSPTLVMKYYPNIINENNFIFPKDSVTGQSLGSRPKNSSFSTTLKNPTVYSNLFVWPTTTINGGLYNTVYEHNGIDLMADFGTPIYAPASGELVYSEWGHTGNNGCDETAYSVSIRLDKSYLFEGVEIKNIFITHMSGIRYRCSTNKCNRKVVKGELIGFVGNASGNALKTGWAPHVHISFYGSDYSKGLKTSQIERLYKITNNTYRKAGK